VFSNKNNEKVKDNEDTDIESFDMSIEPNTTASTNKKIEKKRQFIINQEAIKDMFIKDSKTIDCVNTERSSYMQSIKLCCKDCSHYKDIVKSAIDSVVEQTHLIQQFSTQYYKDYSHCEQFNSLDSSIQTEGVTVSYNNPSNASIQRIIDESKLSITEKERLAFAYMNPSHLNSMSHETNLQNDAILVESNHNFSMLKSNAKENMLGIENISSISPIKCDEESQKVPIQFTDTFSPPQPLPLKPAKECITAIKKELKFGSSSKKLRTDSKVIPDTKATEANEKEKGVVHRKPKSKGCSCMGFSCKPTKRIERI
jgi:hypothetical protein